MLVALVVFTAFVFLLDFAFDEFFRWLLSTGRETSGLGALHGPAPLTDRHVTAPGHDIRAHEGTEND